MAKERKINCSLFESLLSHFKSPSRQSLFYLGCNFTQDEIINEIYRVKNYLGNKGIKKGDIISVMLPNIPVFVFSFYGISANGGIVSLIPTYTSVSQLKNRLVKTKSKLIFIWDFLYNDAKDMLRELKVDAVVCSMRDYAAEKYLQIIEKKFNVNVGTVIKYGDLPYLENGVERTYIKLNGREPAVHISTSGTTGGFPKIVVMSAYNINARIFRHYDNILIKQFNLVCDAAAMVDLQFACGAVSAFGMHLSLCRNKLVILPPELPGVNLLMFAENDIDYYYTHQNIISRTIEHNKDECKTAFSCLKFLNLNLNSSPGKLKEDVVELLPKNCVYADSYGSVELCCVIYQRYNDDMGYRIFGGKHKIKDINSNKILLPFEKGELVVSSPYIMDEYFNGEEVEEDSFMIIGGNKYLRTGDIGYLDKQGRFYYIERLKRMVKIGGYSVFPAEIENVIKTVPGIVNCVVAREKDEKNKYFLIAYLQINGNTDLGQVTTQIKDIILTRFNKYHLPTEFIVVDTIKKTPIGKSDYRYYENQGGKCTNE
jgi:acyl-coenzyme A synthetase/AMP-(fatty) acid ligase